jgi:kinesin family protein 2/24
MIQDYRCTNISKINPEEFKQKNCRITVIIRKRPLFSKELNNGELDCISCLNPYIIAHQTKNTVDLTKYLDNQAFKFDFTYDQNKSSEDIYKNSICYLTDFLFNNGSVTIFAYGQTGSGKTFTMKDLQNSLALKLFKYNNTFQVAFFEI